MAKITKSKQRVISLNGILEQCNARLDKSLSTLQDFEQKLGDALKKRKSKQESLDSSKSSACKSHPDIHHLSKGKRCLRVLVVEDDLSCALVVKQILKILGHECVIVGDGWEAISAILGKTSQKSFSMSQNPSSPLTPPSSLSSTSSFMFMGESLAVPVRVSNHFDLVLMDICLPHLDGLHTTSYLRAAGLKDMPIVAMTGLKEEMAGIIKKNQTQGDEGDNFTIFNEEADVSEIDKTNEPPSGVTEEEQEIWAKMGMTGGLVLGKPFGLHGVQAIIDRLDLLKRE